jgi:hypothetical protein
MFNKLRDHIYYKAHEEHEEIIIMRRSCWKVRAIPFRSTTDTGIGRMAPEGDESVLTVNLSAI